jgi:HEAT repeat protein
MEKRVVQAFFLSWIVSILDISLAYRRFLRSSSVLALGAFCLLVHPLGGMASKEQGFSLLNDLGQMRDPQRKKDAQQTLRRLGRRALPLLRQGLERSRHPQLHREIYALLHSLGEEAAPALPSILRAAARVPSLHPQVIPLFARLGTKVLNPLQEIATSSKYPLAQRFLATRGIGAFGSRAWRSVPQLIALVEGESPLGLRSAAIFALGEIGPMAKESIPALVEAMGNRRIAGVSMQALAKIGVDVLPAMHPLLEHPSPIMRRRAIKVLGLLGEKSFSFRHALLKRLHDNEKTVRREAAKSLHHIGTRVLPALRLVLLEKAHWRQRANAAYTLGLFKEAALPALPELKHALNDPHWKIRRSAAFALSKIGSAASSAAPLLKKALHDTSVDVRHYAVTALLRFSIPQQPLLDALDALLKRTPHLNEMLFLAQHLDHLAPQRYTLDAWQKIYLRTRNHNEKKRSLQGLRAYKRRALPAVPAILSLLHQAAPPMREEIAQTLLQIGQEATPRLLALQRTPQHPH